MARKNELKCIRVVKSTLDNERSAHIEFCNCDKNFLISLLRTISEPDDEYKFPDFVFDGGIIEHFMVAGYKETRKGSEFKIEENKGNKTTKEYFNEEDNAFLESHRNPGTFYTASQENTYDKSTYKDFVFSFKKNVENHMVSLMNSGYSNQTVIFLIEQEDARLCIYKNEQFERFYLLSEDKELLTYLKGKYPALNYVIFNSADSVEIIDLSKIDNLIKNAKIGLDIRSGRKRDLTLKFYWDL